MLRRAARFVSRLMRANPPAVRPAVVDPRSWADELSDAGATASEGRETSPERRST
jgi:hypothetical protein